VFLHILQAAAGNGARDALREPAIILAPSAPLANEEDLVWLFRGRRLGGGDRTLTSGSGGRIMHKETQ